MAFDLSTAVFVVAWSVRSSSINVMIWFSLVPTAVICAVGVITLSCSTSDVFYDKVPRPRCSAFQLFYNLCLGEYRLDRISRFEANRDEWPETALLAKCEDGACHGAIAEKKRNFN